MPNFSITLPEPWAKALKLAGEDAKAQSTSEYLRWIIEGHEPILAAAQKLNLELPPLRKTGLWGGARKAIEHPELRGYMRTVGRHRRPPRRKGIKWDITKPIDWGDDDE